MWTYTVETDTDRQEKDTSPQRPQPSFAERHRVLKTALAARVRLERRVPAADSAGQSIALTLDDEPGRLAVAIWNALSGEASRRGETGWRHAIDYSGTAKTRSDSVMSIDIHPVAMTSVGVCLLAKPGRAEQSDADTAGILGLQSAGGGIETSRGAPIISEEEFGPMNQRRAFLIRKELSEGLSPAEAAELEKLEEAVDRYVDAIQPAPLEYLTALLERARQLKPDP
jgi:hypothetical protein